MTCFSLFSGFGGGGNSGYTSGFTAGGDKFIVDGDNTFHLLYKSSLDVLESDDYLLSQVVEEDQLYSLSTAQMLRQLLEGEEERIVLMVISVAEEVSHITVSRGRIIIHSFTLFVSGCDNEYLFCVLRWWRRCRTD